MAMARYYYYMVVRVLLHGHVIIIKDVVFNCYECACCERLTRYVTWVVVEENFVCFRQSAYRAVFENFELCLL